MSASGVDQSPNSLSNDFSELEIEAIRRDFPILDQKIHGRPLVYLDSAASAQKPQQVIDAISRFYAHDYANIHRGLYELSLRATRQFEEARRKVQGFLGAAEDREIIFVRGTSEAINLVAQTYGRDQLHEGDEILITAMEHHSNIVPWQMLCEQKNARLRVAPMNDRGELLLDEFEKLLSERTRLVAVPHVSNALGTVIPVKAIVELAHGVGAPVLLDGAQAAPRMPVNVVDLDCDFYAFSGHKLYGPSGVGVLYGKAHLLESMPPWEGGGEMIESVSFEKTTYKEIPHKFEAGTPNIAGVVGLGAAVDYLQALGLDRIERYEKTLLDQAIHALGEVPGLRLIGTARERCGVVSFVMDDIHPHDIGTVLDHSGVAIRTGHHCAQPVMERFGVPATARASFGIYNTRGDIEALVTALQETVEMFR